MSVTLACPVLGKDNCYNQTEGQNKETSNSKGVLQGSQPQDQPTLNSGECYNDGSIYQDFKNLPNQTRAIAATVVSAM